MENTMREILFRGKRKEDGEWIYCGYSHCEKDNADFITVMGKDKISHIGCHQQIQPETRGMYTGLTDTNGTKIFEGDICKNNLGCIFKVNWDKENARFLGLTKMYGEWRMVYVGREPRVEVIGNIHDNPELLESEE